MNKIEALQSTRKGTFALARIVSDKKPLKAFADKKITKVVLTTVRTGVEFKNLAVNADRETGKLPWGEWEVYPYAIAHKGNRYLRLYLGNSMKVFYLVDGVKTDSVSARFMIQGETEKKVIDLREGKLPPVYDWSAPTRPHKDLVVETGEHGELLRMSFTQLKSKAGEKPSCITVKETGLVSIKQNGKELINGVS